VPAPEPSSSLPLCDYERVGFLLRVLINTVAIYFAATVVPGLTISGVLPALGAGLVLGLINAIVRPILVVLTLPVTLLTLGLFLFVLIGALIVSVVSWLLTAFVSDRGHVQVITRSDARRLPR